MDKRLLVLLDTPLSIEEIRKKGKDLKNIKEPLNKKGVEYIEFREKKEIFIQGQGVEDKQIDFMKTLQSITSKKDSSEKGTILIAIVENKKSIKELEKKMEEIGIKTKVKKYEEVIIQS